MAVYLDGVAIAPNIPTLEKLSHKSITFTGAAGLGAVGNVPLFTVTGEVEILAFSPYVVLSLTENPVPGGATLALGVINQTPLFIGATLALDLTTGEFFQPGASGTPNAGIALDGANTGILITSNIVGTVAISAINGGTLRFDVIWRPLSTDGSVVAA